MVGITEFYQFDHSVPLTIGPDLRSKARRRARDLLARIRAGENPADDLRKEKTASTVAMLAEVVSQDVV